jgi:hypothetical protein
MQLMSEKKPIPYVTQPKRKLCPVCGQSSYSAAGIHPQCSVLQADKSRRDRLAAERIAADVVSCEDKAKSDGT